MPITRKDVDLAIQRFQRGERPDGFRSPKSWYVLSENGNLYPLKAIYALATNQSHGDFNTGLARGEFRRLGIECKNLHDLHDFESAEKSMQMLVKKSSSDANARRDRLAKAKAKPKPESRLVLIREFDRNPDVIAEVLERAKGICEKCEKKAPFIRKSDRTPYLEVHHITQLSDDGDDTVENAIALCPNCHREKHYGLL